MFLTIEEVERLTGCKRRARQCQQLNKMGIPYRINALGEPIVMSNYKDTPIEEESYSDHQIDELGGEVPISWFNKNVHASIFTPDEILINSESFPNNSTYLYSGLYFLIDDSEIVYVGISKNISSRLLQHKRSPKRFDRIFTIPFPEMLMSKLEEFYIETIKPVYNSNCPPISVNTIELLKQYKGNQNGS